ncbi:hypothetical protein ABUE34_05945 [Kozakia baliensis]|uniref:hypothetical protein n=1 Tax=Kozakia baliensis TaxID=153496 RepID=UPI00345C6041
MRILSLTLASSAVALLSACAGPAPSSSNMDSQSTAAPTGTSSSQNATQMGGGIGGSGDTQGQRN